MEYILRFTEGLFSEMLPFALLIFAGVYLTVKSRFFQFKFLPFSLKYALFGNFGKGKKENEPFKAACTALSATVGTGNIAGVAGAVSLGGAGAVFWMWLTAFAGMIVKVSEILLGIRYRQKTDEGYTGGPMYYIRYGLPKVFSPLAVLFAAAGIPAVFCSGNITQTNAAVLSAGQGTAVKIAGGALFAVVTAAVVIGGSERIGNFTEKLVPFMALLYIALCMGVILKNADYLPTAFKMIVKGAFNPAAVTGGAVGSFTASALTGASRGVFSNEAGLGTSAMAHSSSRATDGVKQSLYGIFEVFVDTIVICTLTALTLLCSRTDITYGSISSTELVVKAFSGVYGKSSGFIFSVMMCLFGISSVIGWGLYGTVCSEFLFGTAGKRIFHTVYPVFCIVGALCSAQTAWRFSAFFNGIMLCVNVPCVLLFSHNVTESFKNFPK